MSGRPLALCLLGACPLALGAARAGATTVVKDPLDAPAGEADVISVSGGYDDANLYLAVSFEPGTFDGATHALLVGLDRDADPMTGVQPPEFFPIGGEYAVYYNPEFSTSHARVIDLGSGETVANVPITLGADSVELIVPLDDLGGDDGVMGFGVASGTAINEVSFAPTDIAPNEAEGGPLLNLTCPVQAPCPADIAEPFGVLDFNDVLEFLSAFSNNYIGADLVPPFGVWDFSDVFAYLVLFGAGCP